jgi:hypothetical protein
MFKRFLNSIQAIAWAGIAVVLAAALLWTLNSSQPQPPGGLAIQITPALQVEQTRPDALTESPSQAQVATSAPPPTHTPQPTASTSDLDPAYHTKQEPIADADLNCDGLQERVVSIDAYYGYPKADKTNRVGRVGVALQTPAQQGYHQAWEYWCDLKNGQPTCDAVVALLPTDGCEQFITFNTWQQLTVFRWNGQDMAVVLSARADSYASTQDPFVLTAIMRNGCASPTKCDQVQTNYAWNGAEFVLAEAALPLRQAQDKAPTPTPKPTPRAAPAFIGLKTEQIVVADVDLNCDGLPERVVKTETYSGYHYNTSGKLVPQGIAAVGIQVPTQQGYQQAWEYVCEPGEQGGPMCNSVLVNLIPAGQCEHFITFNGIFSLEGGWRLKIFRWNGQEGLLVLNEPGRGFELTQDPFVVTTTFSECSAAGCRETHVSYTWNGAEFVQE